MKLTEDSKTEYCLIVPHYSEAIMAFLNVIRALPASGLTPLILVDGHDTNTVDLCQQHGLDIVTVPHFTWRNQIKGPLRLLSEPLRVRLFCRALFQAYPIAAVLLVDDRRYTELFLIEAAHRRNIPCVTLMWAATNQARDMVAWRQKSLAAIETSRWRILKPLVRVFAPQALREIDGQTVYWQHPLAILTLALCARYPPHPWILGGGTSDVIAVIGDHYRDLLVSEGIPPEKVIVTGHPRHDDLVRQAAEWKQKPLEKAYILLAAPPIAHIKQGTRAGHVSPEEMNAYLHWVIEQLLAFPFEIVVKPHPRDMGMSLDYVQNHTGPVRVVNQPIAPLIAQASLLVCQGSSVVYEACSLNIPVVTFDFYHTPGYDMWEIAGVSLHVKERGQFSQIIQSALFDAHLRVQLQLQQHLFVNRYMKLDGKATQRIVSLLTTVRHGEPYGGY
jgi:hypothetical protein